MICAHSFVIMKLLHLNLSDFDSKKAFFISFGLSLLVFFFYALGHSQNGDFLAINGTFQNYNVIRRFLDGQIPYQDFAMYLGPGHLWLCSILTKILGGTFGASMLACNILSLMAFPLMIYGLCRCFFKYNGLIPFLTCMMLIFLDDIHTVSYFTKALCRIFVAGNSGRGIRGMILPLVVVMGGLWLMLIRQKFADFKYRHELAAAGLSAMSGFAFCWSNDYGLCVWISLNFMIFATTIIRTRSAVVTLRTLGIQIVTSALFILITGFLLSLGHFDAWVSGNFAISDYQKWYYNMPNNKIYYFYEFDFNRWTILTIVLFVFYFVQLVKNRADDKSIARYGVLSFCCLTTLGATTEYHYFSGGGAALREIMCLLLYTIAACELLSFLIRRYKKNPRKFLKPLYTTLAIIIAATGIISVGVVYAREHRIKTNGTYVASLDAYFRNMLADLHMTKEFLDEHPGKLFSMYSSAAEVMTSQFQPSGTDYVIHAMSDSSRAHYLESMEQSNPDYVTSIIEHYTDYGLWIRNANWFVYRVIYKNYHIVFQNSYEYFWKRNEPGKVNVLPADGKIAVDIQKQDDTSVRITITAPGVDYGIADVKIDYNIEIRPGLRSKLITSAILGVYSNGSETIQYDKRGTWCLRPKSVEYIPVEIIDGRGSVLLTSYPLDNTILQLNSVTCDEILDAPKTTNAAFMQLFKAIGIA